MFRPKIDRTKVCLTCGTEYTKNPEIGLKQWKDQKFCSRECFYNHIEENGAWNKGLKGTQSSNKGSFKKGEHRSKENEFGSKEYKPEDHWNWKGGITSIANLVRTSNEYKSWRKQVFARDGYKCVWCGSGGYVEADHIKPLSHILVDHSPKTLDECRRIDILWDINNGRTLCKTCHSHRKINVMWGDKMKYGKLKPFTPRVDRVSYGGALLTYEEHDAIMAVLFSQGSSRWTVGPESIAFEKELAEKTGVRRAVVVNSGSSALLVALTALHLPKGSKVIIPAVNFPTAFNAILQCGLVPYVVDVDLKTLNLDLEEVKKAVERSSIHAVIAVNIASNPVDYIALRKIVGDDVKIICDNCDGYGTLVDGHFVDVYADISCVSFHAAHIITTGEGGACLTNDLELADRCLKLREWGRASGTDEIYKYPGFPDDYRSRYVYEEIGYNMKPLELQCAMGRVQLKKLEGFREARLKNAKKMRAIFEKYPQFQLIDSPENAEVCWFSFPLLCKGISRKVVMDTLEANNIECRTIFSGNVLRHPAYKDVEYKSHGEMVNADRVMKDGMFLSVHPSITDEMLDFIDEVLGELCK